MKYYRFVDPDEYGRPIETIMSEQQILDFYWKHWSDRMSFLGREAWMTEENCIQDFITVHWATRCKQPTEGIN